MVTTVREGLLKEKYNLNEKLNMVMLPMDKAVADAIGLPRHRLTAKHRSHQAYSNHVQSKLDKIVQRIKQKLVEHQDPKYKKMKKDIESLSKKLYKAITQSTSKALDEMPAAEFKFS
ncbi:MAG: AHH domain-containing protein [Pirellulaceae bacterium]